MDWLERVNGAINHIEQNLAGDVDIKTVAKIALCSEYQFQRMFAFITDIPLSEYIRRRRLTLAALELQRTDAKIIDLALKYGYDSPISFSRAFRKLHGVTPTAARNIGTKLKAYPPISFHISIKGDVEMNYRIEEKKAFSVFGVEEIFSTENDEDKSRVPEFWTRSMNDGTVERIRGASKIKWDASSRGISPVNAVMFYRETGNNTFPYMICAFTPEGGVPEGFASTEIPGATWAIFTTEEYKIEDTSKFVHAMWKRIYTEWFPTSGYMHGTCGELEMYGVAENNREYCEIWIPVVKK